MESSGTPQGAIRESLGRATLDELRRRPLAASCDRRAPLLGEARGEQEEAHEALVHLQSG